MKGEFVNSVLECQLTGIPMQELIYMLEVLYHE